MTSVRRVCEGCAATGLSRWRCGGQNARTTRAAWDLTPHPASQHLWTSGLLHGRHSQSRCTSLLTRGGWRARAGTAASSAAGGESSRTRRRAGSPAQRWSAACKRPGTRECDGSWKGGIDSVVRIRGGQCIAGWNGWQLGTVTEPQRSAATSQVLLLLSPLTRLSPCSHSLASQAPLPAWSPAGLARSPPAARSAASLCTA